MAQAAQQQEKLLEDLIPDYINGYTSQFEDRVVERFLISRPYDHAIKLKPNFALSNCKLYSLPLSEQKELDKFLGENLQKGYICKSKSPMALLFFFMAKKEKDRLQSTQDYWKLNNGMVKNVTLLAQQHQLNYLSEVRPSFK
uniref:Reverse transcriptase-rnase h-integrase n=2 Tax=Moniliophthora roreri TaxID=221103 RepID=A0A0W0FWY6_MONRR